MPSHTSTTHTLFYGNDNDSPLVTSTNEITGSDPLLVHPAGWNYHLGPNSPAIDLDGDLEPYPIDGDYDIGAHEAHWQHVCLPLILKHDG